MCGKPDHQREPNKNKLACTLFEYLPRWIELGEKNDRVDEENIRRGHEGIMGK